MGKGVMVSPSTSSGQAVPNHDPSTQKVLNEKKEAHDSRSSFFYDLTTEPQHFI